MTFKNQLIFNQGFEGIQINNLPDELPISVGFERNNIVSTATNFKSDELGIYCDMEFVKTPLCSPEMLTRFYPAITLTKGSDLKSPALKVGISDVSVVGQNVDPLIPNIGSKPQEIAEDCDI